VKIFTTAGIAAATLVLASLTPISAASAADLPATGTVTFDGKPVPNVEVGWYDPSTDAAGEAVTDAAGNYSLTVTDGHPYVLYAGIDRQPDPAGNDGPWRSIGGTTFTGTFVGANGADLKYQGRTAFTAPTTGQNIALGHPGAVAVTEPTFAKTRISLTRTDGQVIASQKADASGSVVFAGLIPGAYQLLQQSSAGDFAPWTSPTLAVTAGATTTATPALEKFGSTSGVITNKGNPVKGVKVSSYRGTSYGDGDVTDSKGRYSLKNQPGTYRVVIEGGTDDGSLVNRPVLQTSRTTIVTAATKTTLNIKVKKGGSLSGAVTPAEKGFFQVRVIDKTGALVGGGFFEAKTTKTPTKFSIKAVETGAATVYVSGQTSKLYGSKSVSIRGGKTNSVGTISMTKKTITLSGKVTGVAKGAVRVESEAYGLNYTSSNIKNGRYKVSGIIPAAGTSLVVESAATNVPRATTITTKRNNTKNLKAGPPLASLAGTAVAGGFPVLAGQGNIKPVDAAQADLGSYDIKNGAVASTRVRPGTGTLDLFIFDDASPFVSGAPFWLSLPASQVTAKFTSGQTTDVGTLDLGVNGS